MLTREHAKGERRAWLRGLFFTPPKILVPTGPLWKVSLYPYSYGKEAQRAWRWGSGGEG